MKTIFYLFLALLFSHRAAAQSIFWTGVTDTDWGTGSNWSTNVPPAAADNVFVPVGLARYPVLNGDASIKSLAVQSGSLLTINAGRTLTISGAGVGYSIDLYGRIENNGTIAVTATSDAVYLNGNAQLNNNMSATLSVTTTGNYGVKLSNSGVFTNQTGATATITGNSGSLLFSGGNAPTEMVKNYGKMTLTGQIEKYTDTFHNYPCGVVILTSGEVYNNGGQIINEGFFSAPANLNSTAANFINDGIVYVSGSASYTNNKIRIFNNAASTGIFEFGASNDLTVAGIYKNDAATLSAGDYHQTLNVFTHFGLSAGSQTLYAKITRPGGTCPQIVPFTFVVTTASTFTTHPTNQTFCPGSPASFTVAIANAASYQWQLNTGSGWNNVPATSPYSNVTTATLNISNVTGLNGYQYLCIASSAGGASATSDPATLTISAGGLNPTGTLTWTGGINTDWNTACNWSPTSVPTAGNDVVIPSGATNQPTISTAALAKTVEVQAGATLTIATTKSLTVNGSKSYSLGGGTFTIGLYNAGTVQNNGQLILGNTASVGEFGFWNSSVFNNNAGAEVRIDNATNEGLRNSGTFTNVAKIIIGGIASTRDGLINTATFNNNSGGEIEIYRATLSSLYNGLGGTFTNAAKITIDGVTASTGLVGFLNESVFNNNNGGEIKIDNVASGLANRTDGNFTNAAKITIGSVASAGIEGIRNEAIFNNATGGDIKIDRISDYGLFNFSTATFTNAAAITIGATASVGKDGLWNQGTFNNSGEIKIDRTTERGLKNESGTFTNTAKITIGATASVGSTVLYNYAVFNNNTGGEIRVDNATGTGVENEGGTFNNTSKIIIGFTSSTGQYGIYNRENGTFNNNSGSEITIDKSTDYGLFNRTSTFTNAAKITIGATASVGVYGLVNAFTSSFTNNPGGIITIDNSSSKGIVATEGSTLTNAATIIIGATASTGDYGLANDGTVNNTACGKLIVGSGIVQNSASRTITNAGLVQVAGTLENNGTFTNNGVLKYGSLTGSVTNSTDPSLIVNNTPTPIFTYGTAMYDGIINGIFTDAAATLSAGTFTAPNTFTPSGLPGGSQTLYAKITPAGGACSFVVPFVYNNVVVGPNRFFITTWKTDNAGTSNSTSITIPTTGTGYNYDVDWNNDGTFDELGLTGNATHDYGAAGTYTVAIRGNFPRIYFNDSGDRKKILSVEQWGDIAWSSMESAFYGCTYLVINASDAPDLSAVTSTASMFTATELFNQNINHWDVSNVTDMSDMFSGTAIFNQPLNDWDVSNVKDMSGMFGSAIFNQPLNDWDVSNVKDMYGMFFNTPVFNGTIGSWDVSNVTTMNAMFASATAFNQPIGTWDVSNVTEMTDMFRATMAFNQPIGAWNVGKVTTMEGMFTNATAFNQPIDAWNVQNVTTMERMFQSANAFNQPIGSWNVGKVTTMHQMFFQATAFNQPIGSWDVSNVTDMKDMFANATAFNQPIGAWNVGKVTTMQGMFTNAAAFNQPIGAWNVGSVTTLSGMFNRAVAFNQPLNNWDVSKAINITAMFQGASAFNQNLNSWNLASLESLSSIFQDATSFNGNISAWNVSKVSNMTTVFSNATSFNQDISGWDVSNVSGTQAMFYGATSFNQDISRWNVSEVVLARFMFYGATAFNQNVGAWNISKANITDMFTNSGISIANYDAILMAWNTAGYTDKNLGNASPLQYCAAQAARDNLVSNKGWSITGDSYTAGNCCIITISFSGPNPVCQGSRTALLPNTAGSWISNDPTKAAVTADGQITALQPGTVTFTFTTPQGCTAVSPVLTIKATSASALTASQTDVCPNTEVTLNAHCSIPTATVNWNPGAPTVTPNAAAIPYIYKASCTADGCTGNESSVEVRTHRISVDMKDLDVGVLPLPIARAVKDNMAPTNVIEAPVFPRRWTFIATGCNVSESAVFKLSGPVNFNSIDNAFPYAMFANDANGFYSLDHPNYGNGGSFPNGTYTLTIDLRNADGVGGPFPKNRVATGSLLATRTLEFTVVGPSHGSLSLAAGSRQSAEWGDGSVHRLDFAEILPNPVSNTMHLKINGVKGQKVNMTLIDASGRTMLQRDFTPETHQHQEEFEVGDLASGMYFLRVHTAGKQATLKMVKVE